MLASATSSVGFETQIDDETLQIDILLELTSSGIKLLIIHLPLIIQFAVSFTNSQFEVKVCFYS